MKNAIIGIIILILIVGGYFLFRSADETSPSETATPTMSSSPLATVSATPTTSVSASPTVSSSTPPRASISPEPGSQVKTFNVTAKSFSFSLTEIKVKKGDKVKIVLKNEQGFHDWVLDEFKAKTKQLSVGQTEEIEFTASKTGTFEFYCSVGTHRQMGMVGKLIVE
ncbi:MAG: cupredoxin domain-containing protein [bacterium]|nr:cupredoxin domain-containing protein [bacterium]